MPPEERLTEAFDETEAVFESKAKDTNEELPCVEKEPEPKIEYDETFEDPPFLAIMSAYLCLFLFVVFGHFRDLLRRWGFDKTMDSSEFGNEGFVPLYNDFEAFYTRNVWQRVLHYWCHPLAGVPGAEIDIWDRKFGNFNENIRLQDTKRKYLNIGSYNYLGFAENNGRCSEETIQEIRNKLGTATSSSRAELGTLKLHQELENLIAEFVGKESALVFGMGFATNSMNMATLVDEGCLLISDELNHASLILGARLSGAKIKVFRHNNMAHLEKVLRTSIVMGQPRTRRPWKKILIVVEGIYSMEGTSCNLPKIVELKNKYKAYLYVDEAHSIGAMGKTGRGICEHHGVSTSDIDILMGTFSKSFGAAGGYIAGSRDIIAHLKKESHAQAYSSAMSPPVARQIVAATEAIMGRDGTGEGQKRIRQLKDNTRFFRTELQKRGYILFGELDSPVVPLLICSIARLCAFIKLGLKSGIAPVVVGFPATPMLGARARFCLSASHTRQQLQWMIDVIEKHEPILGLKLSTRHKVKS